MATEAQAVSGVRTFDETFREIFGNGPACPPLPDGTVPVHGFNLRPQVAGFVMLMEQRLREKEAEHPHGWAGRGTFELLLCAQAKMVAAGVFLNDPDTSIKLLVDSANYAMMVADTLVQQASAEVADETR